MFVFDLGKMDFGNSRVVSNFYIYYYFLLNFEKLMKITMILLVDMF